MDTKPLEDLGLTATEIKIYLALLKCGSSKAGELIRLTGIQNSVMHLTLGRLVAEGFASYIFRGQIKIYQPASPERLMQIADSRRIRLQALIPQLQGMQKELDLPEAEIYEGLNGLRNMCFKLIENAEQGDDFLFFGFSCTNKIWEKDVYKFYREYSDIRLGRGLKLKGIAHQNMHKRFVDNKWPHSNIRFVNYPTLVNMSVCRNRVIIVPWKDKQVSFLITSQAFADNIRDYFGEAWKAAGR